MTSECSVLPFRKGFPTFGGVFDVKSQGQRLNEIEKEISKPGAWDNPEALTPLLKEKSSLEDEIGR